MKLVLAAATLSIAGLLAGHTPAAAQEIARKVLLQQDGPPGYQTVLTSVEIPVGVSEIRHTHPGMLVVYVIEGTLALETEGRPRTTYKPGDFSTSMPGKSIRGSTPAPCR